MNAAIESVEPAVPYDGPIRPLMSPYEANDREPIRLRTPLCPLCSRPPMIVLVGSAFCSNENCTVFSWDPTRTLDELLTRARSVVPPTMDASRPAAYSEETVLALARRLHEREKLDPWDDAGCNDDADGAMDSCKQVYLKRARAYLAAVDR